MNIPDRYEPRHAGVIRPGVSLEETQAVMEKALAAETRLVKAAAAARATLRKRAAARKAPKQA